MKIERSHDMGLVREFMSHPRIWPHIHEDGTDEPEPADLDAIHWMLVSDDAPAGFFMLYPLGAACYEVHTFLLPRVWGPGTAQAAQLLMAYVFEQVGALKLNTRVPAYNRRALRGVQVSGMRIEGINRASYLHGGVMHDQIMLGITKEEWKSCQQQSPM